jgi:hypothetical protein
MAAPRKLPPEGAAEHIRRLASEGFGQLGIAAHFNVSRDCFKRWIDEDAELNEAYEIGKETERQALHALVVASAKANKPANVNAFFLLKARHGYVETDNRTKVNVDIAVNNVLVVTDHGSNEEWAAKCAAQQRALTADCTSPLQIEASHAALVDAVALPEPPAIPAPLPTPVAPSWAAPAHQNAPAPYFGPPVFNLQAPLAPEPVPVSEPSPSGPVAPSWTQVRLPAPPSDPPVWRGKA